ncbi:MAG: hypothetical protein AAGB46_07205 [Verrucomicrobiota bacterium]
MSAIAKKSLALLASLVFATLGQLSAQESAGIPVHLKPDAESPQIGTLETIALAVSADWPDGQTPVSGWTTVYFRGVFEVYFNNDFFAKDLSPKPGHPYLLDDKADAQQLAISTQNDKTDLLDVGANFSKIELETIVLAYISDTASPTASVPLNAVPNPDQEQHFKGILVAVGNAEKERSGYGFKIVDTANKFLTYVDGENLPESLALKDFVNLPIEASGKVKETSNNTPRALLASGIKKTN